MTDLVISVIGPDAGGVGKSQVADQLVALCLLEKREVVVLDVDETIKSSARRLSTDVEVIQFDWSPTVSRAAEGAKSVVDLLVSLPPRSRIIVDLGANASASLRVVQMLAMLPPLAKHAGARANYFAVAAPVKNGAVANLEDLLNRNARAGSDGFDMFIVENQQTLASFKAYAGLSAPRIRAPNYPPALLQWRDEKKATLVDMMTAAPDGRNRAAAWIASKLLSFYSDANLTYAMAFDGSAKAELTRLSVNTPVIRRYLLGQQSSLTDTMLTNYEALEDAEHKLYAMDETVDDAQLGRACRPVLRLRQAVGLT